jgi:ornithine cyclodeaminase/alanine dehydrogenase-like protein (mu-crystallin family)
VAGEGPAIFDSTGTALQDVATAALVHERAIRIGCGIEFTVDHRQSSGPPDWRVNV